MFEPGQKVICVDGEFTLAVLRLLQQVPVKDKVYVVRDVKIGFLPVKGGKRDGAVRVLLIGLVNPPADDGEEHGFNSDRFRSLDELKSKVEAVSAGTITMTFADGSQLTLPAEVYTGVP